MYLKDYLYVIFKKKKFLNFSKFATIFSENLLKEQIDKEEEKSNVAKCSDNEILKFYENLVETKNHQWKSRELAIISENPSIGKTTTQIKL